MDETSQGTPEASFSTEVTKVPTTEPSSPAKETPQQTIDRILAEGKAEMNKVAQERGELIRKNEESSASKEADTRAKLEALQNTRESLQTSGPGTILGDLAQKVRDQAESVNRDTRIKDLNSGPNGDVFASLSPEKQQEVLSMSPEEFIIFSSQQKISAEDRSIMDKMVEENKEHSDHPPLQNETADITDKYASQIEVQQEESQQKLAELRAESDERIRILAEKKAQKNAELALVRSETQLRLAEQQRIFDEKKQKSQESLAILETKYLADMVKLDTLTVEMENAKAIADPTERSVAVNAIREKLSSL